MPKFTKFTLDLGNWGVKAVSATSETFFRHAMRPLTMSEWEAYHIRMSDPDEQPLLLKVNGRMYAFGDKAIRAGNHTTLRGSERYEPDYYGPFAAAAMYHCLGRSSKNVLMYSTHAPRDVAYREDIGKSVLGEWIVEDGFGNKKQFIVTRDAQIDEPVGGFRNLLLTKSGKYAKKSGLTQPSEHIQYATALIADVGGETTDFAVAENGVIDYGALRTLDVGIYAAVQDFWGAVTRNNRDLFKHGARKWDDRRIHRALRTGVLDAGGLGLIDVSYEADEALNVLQNDIIATLNSYQAGTAHDIIMTGGGGGILYERLKTGYNHPNTLIAGDVEDVHMANTRGAYKTLQMLEDQGVI